MKIRILTALLLVSPAFSLPAMESETKAQYPTEVAVDYVIGCMAANGQTPEMLKKCSCSIDFIAAAMPIEEYEHVETLLALRQMSGAGRNAIYKNSTWSDKAIARLREIQAESTLRCF